MYTYVHTCTHAFMRTCLHSYRRTCLHAFKHDLTCIEEHMHTDIHTDTLTCTHTHTQTHISAYTPTNRQADKRARAERCQRTKTPARPPTNAREVACADVRPRGLPREDLRSGLLRRPPRHHGLLSKGAAGHPATLKPPRPAAARGFSWPPLSPDKKGGPPRAWAGSRPRSRGAGEGGAGVGGLRGECGAQRPGSLLRVQLVRTPGSQ